MKTYTGRTPRRVLEWLRDHPEPMSAREIADALKAPYGATVDALTLLTKAGAIQRTGTRNKFRYQWPTHEPKPKNDTGRL